MRGDSDERRKTSRWWTVAGIAHPHLQLLPAAVDAVACPSSRPGHRSGQHRTFLPDDVDVSDNFTDGVQPTAVHQRAAQLDRHLADRHAALGRSSRCSPRTRSPGWTSRARSCCCRWRWRIAMFPQAALVGPLFNMWRNLGIYDTWIGLIIPYLTFALPLSIWTMSAFFRQIPWEMEQAAQVDGATAVAGVPQGDRAAGRARRVHHRDPDVLLLLERLPVRDLADVDRQCPHRARGAGVLPGRLAVPVAGARRSWPPRWSSPSPSSSWCCSSSAGSSPA